MVASHTYNNLAFKKIFANNGKCVKCKIRLYFALSFTNKNGFNCKTEFLVVWTILLSEPICHYCFSLSLY